MCQFHVIFFCKNLLKTSAAPWSWFYHKWMFIFGHFVWYSSSFGKTQLCFDFATCETWRNNTWRHLPAKIWTKKRILKAKIKAFAAGMRPVLEHVLKDLDEFFQTRGCLRASLNEQKSSGSFNFTSKFTKEPFWPLNFGCKICTLKGHISKN